MYPSSLSKNKSIELDDEETESLVDKSVAADVCGCKACLGFIPRIICISVDVVGSGREIMSLYVQGLCSLNETDPSA